MAAAAGPPADAAGPPARAAAAARAPKAMKAMNKDNVVFIMASLGKLVLLKYG